MEKKTNVRTETPAPGLEARNGKTLDGRNETIRGENNRNQEDPFGWRGAPFPDFNRIPRPPWEE